MEGMNSLLADVTAGPGRPDRTIIEAPVLADGRIDNGSVFDNLVTVGLHFPEPSRLDVYAFFVSYTWDKGSEYFSASSFPLKREA